MSPCVGGSCAGATHFISYKVRASRTVYTDRKLLQKIFPLHVATYSLYKCMAFRGDTYYINHANTVRIRPRPRDAARPRARALCTINPRRACAARVGLSFRPFVCLSVTTFSATTRNKAAKKRYQRVQCHTGLILKMAIFVLLMSMAQILPVSSTVEAVEVTRRASMWSWLAKNTTYRRSPVQKLCRENQANKLIC